MGDIVNLKRGMLVLIVSILLVNIAYSLIILGKNSLIVEEKVTEVGVAYPAGTGSMLPLIQPDSKMIYSFDVSNLEQGDIIIFRSCDEDYTVHRIYSTLKIQDRLYYITKGDANVEIDNCLITKEMIEGKVIRIE